MINRIFSIIAILEGLSLLFLIFVAMPLKYYGGQHLPVYYGGWAHGGLFLAYIFALIPAAHVNRWSLLIFLAGLFASVIPFGTFAFEWYVKRRQTRLDTL